MDYFEFQPPEETHFEALAGLRLPSLCAILSLQDYAMLLL